jgi:hypothetical protein
MMIKYYSRYQSPKETGNIADARRTQVAVGRMAHHFGSDVVFNYGRA